MSDNIDVQQVTWKLNTTPESKDATLRDALLQAQKDIADTAVTDKISVIDGIQAQLIDFENTFSAENRNAELEASINKLQGELDALETQKRAELAAIDGETTWETKSLREIIKKSDNPDVEITNRWKGIGKRRAAAFSAGGAVSLAFGKIFGAFWGEKKEGDWADATSWFNDLMDKGKNLIADIFGLEKTEKPKTPEESTEIWSEKHKKLVAELLASDAGITFQNEKHKERIWLMSYKTLSVMKTSAAYCTGKGGLTISSTLRSKEENDELVKLLPTGEVDANSGHLYGFSFDAVLPTGATYTLAQLHDHLGSKHTDLKENLIHEGTGEHLHISTESTEGKTPPYKTNTDIENALQPAA